MASAYMAIYPSTLVASACLQCLQVYEQASSLVVKKEWLNNAIMKQSWILVWVLRKTPNPKYATSSNRPYQVTHIVLWEGNEVTDGGLPPDDGAQAVQAKGQTGVRRGAIVEGTHQEAKLGQGLTQLTSAQICWLWGTKLKVLWIFGRFWSIWAFYI